MVRTLLAFLLGLGLSLGAATADDKKGDDKSTTNKKDDKKGDDKHDDSKGKEATITKIDPKAHTVTVKMKGKDNKETEKTFKLAETVRYLDSTGKAIAIDVFKNGDDVLVLEADGQVKEMKQNDKKGGTDKKGSGDKKESTGDKKDKGGK
jgi:hypothetical protein